MQHTSAQTLLQEAARPSSALPGTSREPSPEGSWKVPGRFLGLLAFMLLLCRHLSFQNLSLSDMATVEFLVVFDGVPLTHLAIDGVTLKGVGRYAGGRGHVNVDTGQLLVR